MPLDKEWFEKMHKNQDRAILEEAVHLLDNKTRLFEVDLSVLCGCGERSEDGRLPIVVCFQEGKNTVECDKCGRKYTFYAFAVLEEEDDE